MSLLVLAALVLLGSTTLAHSAVRTAVSAIANPYLFQGRRYDAETGFYYFRNRYYDPRNGRFLQRDPVWDVRNVGGQYAFVGNGPVSRHDPLGLDEDAPVKEAVQNFDRALLKFRALQADVSPEELKQAKEDVMRARIKLDQQRARQKLRESEKQQERIARGEPPEPPPPTATCPAGTRTIEEIEETRGDIIAKREQELQDLERRYAAASERAAVIPFVPSYRHETTEAILYRQIEWLREHLDQLRKGLINPLGYCYNRLPTPMEVMAARDRAEQEKRAREREERKRANEESEWQRWWPGSGATPPSNGVPPATPPSAPPP